MIDPQHVYIRIPVVPEPLRRHRHKMVNGKSISYDPKKNKDFKELVGFFMRDAVKSNIRPLKGILYTHMIFYVPIPQSWSKKKKKQALEGLIEPITRPDLDNYLKMINDSLNNGIIEDDSQITRSTEWKVYSDNPRIDIRITYDKELNNGRS